MGISFEIDVTEGVIYAVAENKISAEDVQAYRKNLRADPRFRPGLGEIVEYRLAKISVSPEEIKTLASTYPGGHSRKIALVGDGPKKKILLRFKEMVRGVPVEVFADMGSAQEWVTTD